MSILFHIERHWRGVAEVPRWTKKAEVPRWTKKVMLRILYFCLILPLLSGCGEKENGNKNLVFVKTATEKLTGIKLDELEKIRADVVRLQKAVQEQNWPILKQACVELDKQYNQRILTWYAELLFLEHTRGTKAAQESIVLLKAQDKLSDKEVRALNDIETYFKNKGDVSTLRLLLSWYAVYLEAEHGHGASAPVGALLELTSKNVQPGGAANESQPSRGETDQTSEAAGSRR